MVVVRKPFERLAAALRDGCEAATLYSVSDYLEEGFILGYIRQLYEIKTRTQEAC